jgi:cytochrome c2
MAQNMFSKVRPFFSLSLVYFLSFFLVSNISSGQDMANGEKIFKANCASCHKFGGVLIGPDLTGVSGRWKDVKKMHEFIKNPTKFIESDPYVKGLYAKYNAIMTPQPLSDQEITDVIAYANAGGKTGEEEIADNGGGADSGGGGSAPVANAGGGLFGMSYGGTVILMLGLFILLLMIAYTLYRIRTQLRRMGVTQEGDANAAAPKEGWLRRNWNSYWRYRNIGFAMSALGFVVFILVVIGLYRNAQDLGTQINYAPEQPIKFNHKIHAGQYGIKCQYCHTGVEKGKQANIPPVATCMNCHNYIKEGPQYGTTEIAKLTKYYETKTPVRWVRIHNLPDHVYFNHSQHVVAGKVQCSSCHGAINEMERVRQVSTLEMGWCINCHRETGVDTKNPYYTATYSFMEKHKKYTVGQLGGLECSKCHY